MSGISFFTPIEYRNQPAFLGQHFTELVDNYFNLGGRVAVVVPGRFRNGSQEVTFEAGNTAWWGTALKVLSYATVILPIIMLAAKVLLRSTYRFHSCGNQPVMVYPDDYAIAKAPLTLVRSEGATDLKISVLYDQKCVPYGPIVPEPAEIRRDGPVSKYTWNVLTDRDGTMTARFTDGCKERINMIWWEAMRKEAPTHVDPTQAVCVERSRVEEFLRGALRRMGIRDKELGAFVHYWNEVLKNDPDANNTPYVLVQLIRPSELGKYIPQMQVEGERADSFALKRFYFRFEPRSAPAGGMEPEAYLRGLRQAELGPNVVIDLGGEVAKSNDVKVNKVWEGADAFNESFIRDYIYA